MGRGRQKAKHTKVARELKYFSPATDYSALERELTGAGDEIDYEAEAAKWADYADEVDEDDDLDDEDDRLDDEDDQDESEALGGPAARSGKSAG